MWKNHYSTLLNSVNSTVYKTCVNSSVQSGVPDDPGILVSVEEVCDAMNALSDGKASDVDHISAEHLKYAGPRLPVLLSLLFSAVLRHGYVPPRLLNIVLIPIIKKINGNVTDRDNYRCFFTYTRQPVWF